MMGFFPEGAVQPPPTYNPLSGVVRRLSVTAKKAMYAAAKKSRLNQRTWDGCAFNAGGLEVGKTIFSFSDAAEAFGMREEDVRRFIHTWDNLDCSNEKANRYLIEAIENAGICTPVGKSKRVIRGYVYKSEATKFAEQLDSGELTVQMIPGCEEAMQLLGV